MSETLWRLRVVHGIGWRIYLDEYPPKIFALTYLPRAVLQALFFVFLVGAAGAPGGQRFAVVGVAAVAMTLFTVMTVEDVTALEGYSGTYHRHRTAVVGTYAVFAQRSVPHVVAGVATAVVVIATVGPLTGNADLSARLIPVLPIYVLMAVTCAASGLAMGILVSLRGNGTLVGNLLSYLILAFSGAVVPVERLGPLADVGSVLPMTHGISAIRMILDGRNGVAQLSAEVVVGVCWAALGWIILQLQHQRTRRSGIEDFG
ncbi:MAG: ABC transporter permease [Stackebrandtia sp.]